MNQHAGGVFLPNDRQCFRGNRKNHWRLTDARCVVAQRRGKLYHKLRMNTNSRREISFGKWISLRQEPEAPLTIAASRNCLLATPCSSQSRGSAFPPPGGSRGMPRRRIASRQPWHARRRVDFTRQYLVLYVYQRTPSRERDSSTSGKRSSAVDTTPSQDLDQIGFQDEPPSISHAHTG